MGYVGNEPSVNFTSFAKQDLTGVTGSPVKRGFTLTYAVANANEIEVFVNNVRQEPTEAYTVSGTALTMTGDVETTDDFYVIYLGKALQTTTPPDGSVTSAKISYPLTTFSSTGIDDNATSTVITIDSSENVGIGTSSPVSGTKLTLNDSAFGGMQFQSGGSDCGYIGVSTNTLYVGGGSTLAFHTGNAQATDGTERMRIADQSVGGGGHTSGDSDVSGTGFNFRSPTGGTYLEIGHSTGASTGYSFILCRYNGSSLGGISQNGTTGVTFNTTSDHRLKENVTADWDATTRLKQLNPVRFNFIADADTTVDGFLAHEVQSVVPEAITGTHNEVDADGNPVYQGIDQSKLVPLLVKTIQELEARITALENS